MDHPNGNGLLPNLFSNPTMAPRTSMQHSLAPMSQMAPMASIGAVSSMPFPAVANMDPMTQYGNNALLPGPNQFQNPRPIQTVMVTPIETYGSNGFQSAPNPFSAPQPMQIERERQRRPPQSRLSTNTKSTKPRKVRWPNYEEDNPLSDKRFNFWNLDHKSKVLAVHNVPDQLAVPQKLYNLFSMYGHVNRVKIGYKMNSVAFVEFETASFAMIARNNLDHAEVDKSGQKLQVSFARFARVRMPAECGHKGDTKSQDFSSLQGPLWRPFDASDANARKAALKLVHAPTAVLRISNLSVGTSALHVQRYAECRGFQVAETRAFTFTPPHMVEWVVHCVLQFENAAMALGAAMELNGAKIQRTEASDVGLRTSFAVSVAEETDLVAKAGGRVVRVEFQSG